MMVKKIFKSIFEEEAMPSGVKREFRPSKEYKLEQDENMETKQLIIKLLKTALYSAMTEHNRGPQPNPMENEENLKQLENLKQIQSQNHKEEEEFKRNQPNNGRNDIGDDIWEAFTKLLMGYQDVETRSKSAN